MESSPGIFSQKLKTLYDSWSSRGILPEGGNGSLNFGGVFYKGGNIPINFGGMFYNGENIPINFGGVFRSHRLQIGASLHP